MLLGLIAGTVVHLHNPTFEPKNCDHAPMSAGTSIGDSKIKYGDTILRIDRAQVKKLTIRPLRTSTSTHDVGFVYHNAGGQTFFSPYQTPEGLQTAKSLVQARGQKADDAVLHDGLPTFIPTDSKTLAYHGVVVIPCVALNIKGH